jgi:hypothetical protein
MRADAHHRYAETYVEDEQITIEGNVVQWEYRNPHSFVHVIARDERQRAHRWIVEFRGAGQLRQHGVTVETIKPGQHVIITGSPGRVTADHRLRLRAIVRPQDGWKWSEPVG